VTTPIAAGEHHDVLMSRWTVVVPVLAALVLGATWGSKPATVVLVLVGALLAEAVLSAVHHAEVVAHRVGEPFGSLVLAVAVTVIEVALIITLMVSGGSDTDTLARDIGSEHRQRDADARPRHVTIVACAFLNG
jgi:Ca2+/H+ antiporter